MQFDNFPVHKFIKAFITNFWPFWKTDKSTTKGSTVSYSFPIPNNGIYRASSEEKKFLTVAETLNVMYPNYLYIRHTDSLFSYIFRNISHFFFDFLVSAFAKFLTFYNIIRFGVHSQTTLTARGEGGLWNVNVTKWISLISLSKAVNQREKGGQKSPKIC